MLVGAILEWEAEAEAFSATCSELNFVSSCGKSREEAIEKLKDAIQLMLETLLEHLLDVQSASDVVELAI